MRDKVEGDPDNDHENKYVAVGKYGIADFMRLAKQIG